MVGQSEEAIASSLCHVKHLRGDAQCKGARPGRLLPLAERAVAIGYRRHLEHYSVELTVETIEEAIERSGMGRTRLGDPRVIAFLDLTGFTALTEEEGDAAAAEAAERLTETVREQAASAGGRAVKFIGDGGMLQYPDPASAVRSALDLVDQIPDNGLPHAHVGINSGPVVFSDGDYFGRTVNLAARIADQAGPHQVLVADGVLDQVPSDLKLTPLGSIVMKGFVEPVLIHHATRAHSGAGSPGA
jgi:adenylate cyclase